MVAAGRAVKTDTRTAWVAGAIALAIVGATAGWVTGRWDEESWIGRQYQLAADLMQSVKPLSGMFEGTASAMQSPTAEVRGEAPPVAVARPARSAAPGSATPGPAASAPAVVDPRPTATPPAGSIAGTERTASLARPATSLVPIKPTTEPVPLAEAAAPPPALTNEPWSVRDVQRELARLGYYQGGVDGEVGPMTRNAVRAFQVEAGMRPTGRIEPALLAALSDRIAENTTKTNNPKASP